MLSRLSVSNVSRVLWVKKRYVGKGRKDVYFQREYWRKNDPSN